MTNTMARRVGMVAVCLAATAFQGRELFGRTQPGDSDVVARFGLGAPEAGPFPSDIFTVVDASQNTGRRLAYPLPNCAERPSDCADLAVVNTLDGWGVQTRVSVPFTGDIDPETVTSDSMFVVSLGSTLPGHPAGGERVGINQVVWDIATKTVHFEVDRVLDQHRRYAVIVTKDVLDTRGRKVKKSNAFENYETSAPAWYATDLGEALRAAHSLGIPPGSVVSASVFTTQTITSLMERIRDEIKTAVPAPADFVIGPGGTRAVFNRADVATVTYRQHTGGSTPTFTNSPVAVGQLDAVPGAVGTIAYGRYVSPDYLVHPGQFMPPVGTLSDVPPVQSQATVYFTLYLPSGPKPAGGWPIVLVGGGASGNQHVSSTIFASKFASHGLATIGISHVGQGFGPLSRLLVTRTNATVVDLPDAGRGADQNGDNVYAGLEGSEAADPLTWTISLRDTHRQTVIDHMQLVRVIEVGMDVDGDALADIDPTRIYYQGSSAGSMFGVSLVALDPSIAVAAFGAPPGLVPEHVRWQPIRRTVIARALQNRIPSLISGAGLASIDGVAVAAPHFDENKPLRDQPVVINTVAGATAIQQALEFAELVSDPGIGAVTWAKYLRATPLQGSYAKAILYQMAKGDQQAPNPGTSAILREGGLADRATFYRHDLAFAMDPTIPTNPHLFAGQPTSGNATVRAVSLAAQEQIAVFFASDGLTTIQPTPVSLFEVSIAHLTETLNYIR
jgi:hypothetical protein